MIQDPCTELDGFFAHEDLDLRKTGFSRFMDQKVTPDVLSFISDCILNLPNRESFTTDDIWRSTYFGNNVRIIFGKPSPYNQNAKNEYDKFIIQPLRVLYYSKVLCSVRKGSMYTYSIKNYEMLEYISIKERNAYLFLYHYLSKVLSDSGLIMYFERFKDKCGDGSVSNGDYDELRDRYVRFMRGHTKINQDVEIRRIFPKILNIYAYRNMINGSEKGRMSKNTFQWIGLMYNRENWRDVGKDKGTTRSEARQSIPSTPVYREYQIQKAKSIIAKLYPASEVKDKYELAGSYHVHHIFPVSTSPDLAAFLENLIKLSPTQHLSMAHPGGKTQAVDPNYQLTCIFWKSKDIEESLNRGEMYYTLPNFIYVLNTSLNLSMPTSATFDDIHGEINTYYNKL